ncbi:transmembrane protein 59 isoform X3 [Colius striatus]|uniref:transmembrane protein 59 isoform X3 n=1 Tax=Colius striatus TaxID=57412 RepID=UPI002B1D4218|nr:transmembrane protein 59 isoform X3 [Colius striatus]
MAARRGALVCLPLALALLAGSSSSARAAGPLPAASSEAFDSVLGNTASCHRACQLTYSLHTYPKEEELYACQRGCRLFSICQFVDDGIDLNRTKQECDSACTEAYSQSDEQYACHLGCQNQLPFAELRQEQSKPEVQYVPQLDQETGDTRGSLPLSKTASALRPGSSQTYRGLFEERENDSFFKCLSINSSWILTTTLVLSVLVLLWICCATVATAVEQYVPSEKLSIYGDLEYMNEQKLNRYPSSALVVVRCKTEEHEEAGPLPTKVNLDQSAI